MHGYRVTCVEHKDHEDVGAPPSLKGVDDGPNDPDVSGILHADIAGNDLVLSEGHVLRVHLG